MAKINYNELKLGENAKEAFLSNKTEDYIINNCPIYLNTKPVFAGLNVTDIAIAGVLAGMHNLVLGRKGVGKSQLARDFHNYYFNGSIKEDGHAITIEGEKELDIYRDVLTDIDREKIQRVLNGTHKSLFWDLEEINRCPAIAQNQFFAVGNGRLIHKGETIPIGEHDYVSSVATANYGNGEYKGTFEMDEALLNRFGLVLDLDYSLFQPTREDRILIDKLRSAHPGIKEAPKRDLTEKIIEASREISELTKNPGLEALAAINYIKFGLENCSRDAPKSKGKDWPYSCQDCSKNTSNDAICSLVREPVPRTLEAVKRYSAALYYMIKLKNPDKEISPVDLIFKAFELASAYQNILNPAVLKSTYFNEAPKMMAVVADKLKGDFNANRDYILTSLEEAEKGNKTLDYFEHEGKKNLGYDKLNEDGKKKVAPVDVFNDNRLIGLSWVKDGIEAEIKISKSRSNK